MMKSLLCLSLILFPLAVFSFTVNPPSVSSSSFVKKSHCLFANRKSSKGSARPPPPFVPSAAAESARSRKASATKPTTKAPPARKITPKDLTEISIKASKSAGNPQGKSSSSSKQKESIAASQKKQGGAQKKKKKELRVINTPSHSVVEPIPFVLLDDTSSFIECFVDSTILYNDIEYSVGIPVDHAVVLGYYDDPEIEDALVPIEPGDPLLDDVFPEAQILLQEEFGEEMELKRTPGTLTLAGEFDDDDDEMEDEEEEQDRGDDEERVETILEFEHEGRVISLMRLVDPVLLVGKQHPDHATARILLEKEEADRVIPDLEEAFLKELEKPQP